MNPFPSPFRGLSLRELLNKPIDQKLIALEQGHYLILDLLHAHIRQFRQLAEAGINLSDLSGLLAEINVEFVDEVGSIAYHKMLEEFAYLSGLGR